MKQSFNSYQSIEKKDHINGILNHFNNKHKTIINDYKTPDTQHIESCGWVAFEMAELLINAGKEPYIIKLRKNENSDSKEFYPVMYNKRVRRYTHQICCCEDMIYDPILPEPIKITLYCKTVFGEDIPMEILYNKENTKRNIQRKSYFV